MDLKAVIESGTEALTDQVEKVAASISPNLASLVETPLGQQISAIVSTAGAKAEEALHSRDEDDAPPEPVAKVAEHAGTADAVPASSGDLAAVGDGSSDSGSGSHKALIVGGSLVVAGAAAAAAVVVYRRRRSAREDEWNEDTEGAVVTPISTSEADDAGASQAADSADKEKQMTETLAAGASFVHEIDEEAEHFAQDFVDHIDDEDGAEILDPDFVIEVDMEADHFAQELIDHIEVTDEDLAAEEALDKQS